MLSVYKALSFMHFFCFQIKHVKEVCCSSQPSLMGMSVYRSLYSHTPPMTIKDWPFNRPKNLFKKKLSILCNTETFEIDIFLFFNFRQAFNFQLYTDLLVIKQYISRRKNNSELLNIITFLALTFILSKRLNYLRGTIILLQNTFVKKGDLYLNISEWFYRDRKQTDRSHRTFPYNFDSYLAMIIL